MSTTSPPDLLCGNLIYSGTAPILHITVCLQDLGSTIAEVKKNLYKAFCGFSWSCAGSDKIFANEKNLRVWREKGMSLPDAAAGRDYISSYKHNTLDSQAEC